MLCVFFQVTEQLRRHGSGKGLLLIIILPVLAQLMTGPVSPSPLLPCSRLHFHVTPAFICVPSLPDFPPWDTEPFKESKGWQQWVRTTNWGPVSGKTLIFFSTFESILNLWIHLLVVQPTKSVDVSLQNCVFLDHLTPFGVPGRVLKPMWAACGQRQGTPLNELPAHCRAIYEHLGVWTLVQRNLSGALKVSSHLAFFYTLKSLS